MSGHYIRKRAWSAGWAWSLASFAAMLLLVALVFFRLGALDLQGIWFSLLGVASLVVLALLLALVAIVRAWRQGHRGGGRAVAAFAFSSVLAVPFAFGIALAIEHPTSNMAQTDGMPATAEAIVPDASASLLLGRDFRATAAEVYSAARNSIEASGWNVVDVEASALPEPAEGDLGVSGTVEVPVPTLRDSLPDPADEEEQDRFALSDSDQYTIAAVAYAPVFAFESDVTIRIVEENGTTFVDMRSVSRDLPRDLGQNRRFIEDFFARLEAAVNLLQSGPLEE